MIQLRKDVLSTGFRLFIESLGPRFRGFYLFTHLKLMSNQVDGGVDVKSPDVLVTLIKLTVPFPRRF